MSIVVVVVVAATATAHRLTGLFWADVELSESLLHLSQRVLAVKLTAGHHLGDMAPEPSQVLEGLEAVLAVAVVQLILQLALLLGLVEQLLPLLQDLQPVLFKIVPALLSLLGNPQCL